MDSVKEITVEPVPEVTDEVRVLIGELDRILAAEYPPEQRHGLSLDEIFNPGVRFFLARSNGAAVGCGGVAFFADFAEVKRMYVREAARGRGVARHYWRELKERRATPGWSCCGSKRARVRRQR